jgi:hypothetical protein
MMNKTQIENRLGLDQVEMVMVDDSLHQRVMNAVRQESVNRAPAHSFGFYPVLAAGAAATLAAVLIWNFPGTTQPLQPLAIEQVVSKSPGSSKLINQRVAAIGSQVKLPEAALRQELDRLEADLKRFRLSS